MSLQTLSFYALGESFTTTIRDHLSSGFFHTVSEIITDGLGQRNNDVLKAFFKGEMHFIGDTRDDSMELVSCDGDMKYLIDGWSTKVRELGYDIYEISHIKESDDKHIQELFNIFTLDEFREMMCMHILEADHWKVYNKPPLHNIKDGVFLQDGRFVECGFEQHVELYEVLYHLGLASDKRWGGDNMCIHISSKSASGKVAHAISHYGLYYDDGVEPTKEQLQAIFDWREYFNSFYRERKGSLINALLNYTIDECRNGAKYGGLVFLDRFYNVSIPKYSTTPFEGKYALRTSPNRSMAGILNSHFNVTKDTHVDAVASIMNDWEKADEKLKSYNELHVFCQEQIDGEIGVCHYLGKNTFEYAIGERHEVVDGKKTYGILSNDNYDYLRSLTRNLYNDLGKQIQVEFAVKDEKVYILQLRTIQVPTEESTEVPTNIIASGFSFNSGDEIVDKDDCIIVDSDVESNDVVGKKAIIVREDIAFSHALALSRMLNIPSIYGIGDEELPNKFRINTKHRSGYIQSV